LLLVFFFNVNTVAHASNDENTNVVDISTPVLELENAFDAAKTVDSDIGTMGLPDLTPLKGAYVKSNQYAAGGRVNIDYEYIYMRPQEARVYASKVEASKKEAAAWIAVSWIPKIGAITGTLGSLSMLERAAFATEIRKYTDKNQSVRIVMSYDKWYGFRLRTAELWDGRIGGVKTTLVI
jgi:hypothetical protein